MSDKSCRCGKEVPAWKNFCSWECHVDEAREIGGKEHLPNGLPIRCIKSDGTMLEHEHGDHPDYQFPVGVEYVGPLTGGIREDFETLVGRAPLDDEELRKSRGEVHALIYSDGSVAVTIDECCYSMWHVSDGALRGGSLWGNQKDWKDWRLSEESLAKIREKHPR